MPSRFSAFRLRWPVVLSLVALAACAAAPRPAGATENRFWLAAQHDWGARRGFCLNFENSAPGEGPCKLSALRLILGVADGKEWRYITVTPAWQFGLDYALRAVMGPGRAELWLDGKSVGALDAVLKPDPGPFSANAVPGWASGRAEYLIRQLSLRMRVSGGRTLERTFPATSSASAALALFASPPGATMPWPLTAGETLTIEADVRIVPYPSLRTLAPFIDRYGQSRHAEYPGKVRSDADLFRATAEEARRLKAMPRSPDYDRYGGSKRAAWHEKPTGFFRVKRVRGTWWLVSPEGNPCFYVGANSAPALSWEQTPVTDRQFLYEWLPPKTPPYSAAWAVNSWGGRDGTEYVAFHTANLIRKYGQGWDRKASSAAARRLAAWGFSGGGKWGAPAAMSCTPVLGRWDVPNLVRHPDVFDPAVRQALRESLRKQIEPRKRDPFVLGWSLGNEYDEIITRDETIQILAKPAATPARRALLEYARKSLYGGDGARMASAWGAASEAALDTGPVHPPAADVERLRLHYAGAYYACVYNTVKEIDPNHLYLGFWIVPGWWENAGDWAVSAPYCDVIGYDRYAVQFADDQLLGLMRQSGKPVLCGEFSYPPWYGGARGFGVYGVYAESDAAAGDMYARWVADAARNPYCVGTVWFQYRDQPLTGRGPGRGQDLVYGEHYAFGLVDVADNPKWDLVERMRRANLAAVKLRPGGSI